MKAKEYILNKLTELSTLFTDISIRYEFRTNTNSHLIEVTPLYFYENNQDYLIAESNIEDEFESLFPSENVVFISENSLTEIKEAELEFGIIDEITFNNYNINIEFEVKGYSGIAETIKPNEKYALAA